MADEPVLITDAAPSFDDEQSRRRRVYAIIMVVHLVGFGLSYPLYLWRPWAGVVAVVLTGALPWVAVLLANDAPCRAVRSDPARSTTARAVPAPPSAIPDGTTRPEGDA